jgi:hypothetical protein
MMMRNSVVENKGVCPKIRLVCTSGFNDGLSRAETMQYLDDLTQKLVIVSAKT